MTSTFYICLIQIIGNGIALVGSAGTEDADDGDLAVLGKGREQAVAGGAGGAGLEPDAGRIVVG